MSMRHFFYVVMMMVGTVAIGGCAGGDVKLITLDPGHFHAGLVQKTMYPGVDPVVHVYAPGGKYQDDLNEHLKRVAGFNARAVNPTVWKEDVYAGPDYFERMLAEQGGKPGEVVVIAGNNARKTEYILKSVRAGLNVLGDKPMAINPNEFEMLKEAFATAAGKHVMLYDIMTERYEIWTMLQRELSQNAGVFGELEKGTPENPAITMESVHYFSKIVAGSPLKRPTWFFDVRQEGEGIVDVTSHLVDLVQWEAFPEQVLSPEDVTMNAARRTATALTKGQFNSVTGRAPQEDFPDFLRQDVKNEVLQVYSNGQFEYTLRGVHTKVSVVWNFASAPGAGDSHYSVMRGTQATLTIKQGQMQSFKPVLYVENMRGDDGAFEAALKNAVKELEAKYPGIGVRPQNAAEAGGRPGGVSGAWAITVPASYDVGHEAHFSQVTNNFLAYLKSGQMPAWEVPGMITKYATLMKAYEVSHR
ncbi:MAG TPA: putative oxidoreductase C-terminal domain-containing protein [Phycisphaerae bacterium]